MKKSILALVHLMKHTRKIIPFLLALFFVACEKEDILIGEWSLIGTGTVTDPNIRLHESDSTIVFYPDGKFQGSFTFRHRTYQVLSESRIGMDRIDTDGGGYDFVCTYRYFVVGDKLTVLFLTNGPGVVMPYSALLPVNFMYRKK
ncbi:MAG: hypothetical protein LBD89_00540 [Tannerellaceae bacterium]|jgi:hypothetical protein|nr:hypothetical protein [Tannerellaceae bacterium]